MLKSLKTVRVSIVDAYLLLYNTTYKYTNFQIRVFAYTNKKVSEQYKSNGIDWDSRRELYWWDREGVIQIEGTYFYIGNK